MIGMIVKQIGAGLPELRRRLGCYARGDFAGAAAVSTKLVDAEGEIPWLTDDDEDTAAEYALQASLRSFAQAETAAAGLQGKANALVGITLALSTTALAATSASLHVAHNPAFLQWLSFSLWCVVDLVLLCSTLYAFLATTTRYGSGLNVFRLRADVGNANGYKRQEAIVWHRGALRAMESATRLGNDIFTSRRWLLSALMVAFLATIATVTRTA